MENDTSYLRLLVRNIRSRKSEFFIGLLLSIVAAAATAWLQYRHGMLERKHLWDGIVTTALPIASIVAIFAVIEMGRAAVFLHRDQQQRLKEYEAQMRSAAAPGSAMARLNAALRQIDEQNAEAALAIVEASGLVPKPRRVVTQVPRKLSAQCRSTIIGHLKPFVSACLRQDIHLSASVLWSALSNDASAYAHQLADALRDAGVIVQPQKIGQLSDFEARDCHGLIIRRENTWGAPEDPPFHETLQTALKDCGIAAPIVYAAYPPAPLVLVVGNAD